MLAQANLFLQGPQFRRKIGNKNAPIFRFVNLRVPELILWIGSAGFVQQGSLDFRRQCRNSELRAGVHRECGRIGKKGTEFNLRK